jgi:hypothetical protein
LLALALVCSGSAFAQAADHKEAAAIIELGGASSRNIKDANWSYGPDIAIEVTPIEKWLELEAGVTPVVSVPFFARMEC